MTYPEYQEHSSNTVEYLYNPHEFGIPFSIIEAIAQDGVDKTYPIISGSGRILECRSTKHELYVKDRGVMIPIGNTDNCFCLWAQVLSNTAYFGLYTQWKEQIPGVTTNNGKHKDMFAGRFVSYSVLRYFPLLGTDIKRVRSTWLKDSFQYTQFLFAQIELQNDLEAAKNTWDGNLLKQLEFFPTRIDTLDEAIIIEYQKIR